MHKRIWTLAAVFLTLCIGVFYVAIQQALRLGANDPQISIAQDVAAALQQNRKPADMLTGRIEIPYNMAPFVIIYDNMGNVVAGDGYVDGDIPIMPFGVLQRTSEGTVHTVTWEPKPGVRIASVSTRAGNYYVVSGRSLLVVEDHIASVTTYAGMVWLLSMATIGAAFLIVERPWVQKTQTNAH